MSDHQKRHWCFTWNNPPSDWNELCYKMALLHADHFAYQLEQAPNTGTMHVQGYVAFPGKGLRLGAVKQLLNNTVHWEAARNPHKAWQYAQKEDSRADEGRHCACAPAEPTAGLKQNRWDAFKEFAQDHGWLECFDSFSDLVKNQGAMRAIYERKLKLDHDCEKKVTVFWGPTGVGKTYTAKQMLKDRDYYRKDCTTKWWDGYAYEDTVWLDDMQPKSGFTRSTFLQLLDRGVVSAEVKGGTTTIVATTIIITSNYNPEEWFEKGEAIVRRLSFNYEVKKGGEVVEVRQRQGNTIPAVAQKVQKSIFEMMQKEVGVVLGADEDDTPTTLPLDEKIHEEEAEDWEKKEAQLKKFARLAEAAAEYWSENETPPKKKVDLEKEEGTVFTASLLRRQNAQLPLDIF